MKSRDTRREIAGIIGRLLMHYYAPHDLSAPARKAMAADWLEDLEEFEPDVVADACREWRRKPGSRRPLPGDIRQLCIAEQQRQIERRAIAGPDGERPWTYPERRAALDAERERNRPAELANYERLKRLDEERNAKRIGALRPVKELIHTTEQMRQARIALGIEPAEPTSAKDAAE